MSISIEDVMAAVRRDDGTGFCLACDWEQGYVDADARGVECEECGAMAVSGAEECLIGAVA